MPNFIQKGLTKSQVEDIGKETKLLDNCYELFKILYDNDVKIFICSGSNKTMIEVALNEDIRKMITYISANYFEFSGNNLLNKIIGTKYDFEGKASFIQQEVLDKYGLTPSEIAFVGNSDNDIYAYRTKVRVILVNPHNVDPGDKKIWNYVLPQMNDLNDILPFLLPIPENESKKILEKN